MIEVLPDNGGAYTAKENAHHTDIVSAIAANDLKKFELVLGDHLAWVLGMLMHVRELFETPNL